ncbi:hypothetical protein D3C80_1342620 [compost metagenome]
MRNDVRQQRIARVILVFHSELADVLGNDTGLATEQTILDERTIGIAAVGNVAFNKNIVEYNAFLPHRRRRRVSDDT